MDPMWAQGQCNMALKCIGISEEHVIDANCSGDFWCPFLWTSVVCPCMWQMIMACIPLEEGTSFKMSCLFRQKAPVLEMPRVHRKVDLWSKVKMSWEASFLLHDTELLTLCRRRTPPPPVLPGPEMTEDPFGSSGSRRTAASDSRGHRDRQQTRQLRKDLTLLFSIINEQQSKQIRTEGGWGLPVCCSGAERSTLGLTTKCYTPTDLLKCDFA